MPWNKVELMSQRKELIEKLLLPGSNISALCKEYSMSRKTAYKWLERYKRHCFAGLADQSKAPCHRPLKISDALEERIVILHKEFPHWGPRKLRNYMLNEESIDALPSASTFARVLKRNHCEVIKNFKSKAAKKRFERSEANELWQMDFKGSFMTGLHRCYPLTIIDDHSRFSIGLQACKKETAAIVKKHLTLCFKEFGLPQQINVDNGNPWGCSHSDGYTQLSIWLIKLGIHMSHSSPYHPQTNGKDERFHRTLKLEVLHDKKYKSCRDIQIAFDQWRHIYNYKRPHDALNGKPPRTRYVVSGRSFPDKLPVAEYDKGEIVRKVNADTGVFRFKGHRYRAGKGLGGEYIAIKETAMAHEFCIFFMDTFIKKFSIEESA